MGRGMTLLHKYLGRGDRIEWTGLTWRVREKVNRRAPLTYRTYDRTGNNGIEHLERSRPPNGIFEKALFIKDILGNTALHYAAEEGNLNLVPTQFITKEKFNDP